MAKVCHVEEVQWNPVQKRLLLTNVTVTSPGMQEPSLRVGRLFVSWESYTKPCLTIELDDVDVLLEFTNLLLTKNNWDELYQAGFPPPMMAAAAEADGDDDESSLSAYSFVRIGSMDLSGTLQAQIRSRPLGAGSEALLCPPWTLDLDTFDEWNTELQRLSNQNLVRTGRRGCTTLQLYDWLETYVGGKLRTVLSSTAYDLLASQPFAETDTDTVRRAKGFLRQARKTVFSYAKHASKKSGKDLQDNVMGRLESLGIKDTVLEATVSRLGAITAAAMDDRNETDVVDESLTKIRVTYQSLRDAATKQLNNVKGALRAAEEADAGQPEVIFPPDR